MKKQDIIEVVMPQMGESVADATITHWRKKVGEPLEEEEPLLDISTAKVEVELPAPASGVLARVFYDEGETVPVNTVIALISKNGMPEEKDLPHGPPQAAARPEKEPTTSAKPAAPEPPPKPAPSKPSRKPEPETAGPEPNASAEETERERQHLLRRRSTPLVRRIADEFGVDIAAVEGTGVHGRVTRKDIEQYIAHQKEFQESSHEIPTEAPPKTYQRPEGLPPQGALKLDTAMGPFPRPPQLPPKEIPVSTMRRHIADQMVRSVQTIPQAYTVHEVDFTHLEKVRLRYKPIFEAQFDTRLTPLVFMVSAVKDALLNAPSINSTWSGDRILVHQNINIGIAVALRQGLVVPVLKGAESMSLAGIARGIVDLAKRARSGKLQPDDMEGGTFTITSTGQLGATMAIPLVNYPQGAILHFGAIQKVPVVVTGPDGEDCIAVRQRAHLTLGIDHRLVDGWEADKFMLFVKERIERADFGLPA